MGRTCEIGAHTFPILWAPFFHQIPFYGILHDMGNACVFSLIFHNLGKDSQNHRMGKVWEIGSRKYPTKPIACGEPGKLVLILFPQYGCFFPIRFTFYGIICEIHGFPHQFPIAWEDAVKSIELGEPRKLVPIFSLTYGYFSSIRFPFYGIFCYHRGNAWFFPSKSTLRALWLFFHSITFSTCSKIYWFLKRKNKKTR